MHWYVCFEPVYSQGIGNFEMITKNIKNIKLFLNEFDKYKNYLETIDGNIENWEFYEYVYEIFNYDENKILYDAICIYKKYHVGKNIETRKINFQKDNNINGQIEKINFDHKVKLNNVYINYEYPPLEIEFKHFDILQKNYTKK